MNLKEIKSRLKEDLQSALIQLSNALNKDDEADIEKFTKHSLEIIKGIIRIYDIELTKEPKKKDLLNGKTLFLDIYNALEEEEYSKLEELKKRLKKL